eukprot:IDg22405t1
MRLCTILQIKHPILALSLPRAALKRTRVNESSVLYFKSLVNSVYGTIYLALKCARYPGMFKLTSCATVVDGSTFEIGFSS